jgi:hypothetical protein
MTATTTTLHMKVERSRFAQHAYAALTGWLAPKPSTVASEAAAVREMAYAYSKTDPAFADDLYAAANRHEMIHGDA